MAGKKKTECRNIFQYEGEERKKVYTEKWISLIHHAQKRETEEDRIFLHRGE